MPFSRRTHWERHPNPLAQRLAALLASGAPVLDLTESNPTRCGFAYPEAAVLEAISDPASLRYEPAPAGSPAAREAIAGYYAARSGPTDPASIVLTASTSEAYSWIFRLLCEPGDAVLVPTPGYPLFEFLARGESVDLIRYPLVYDGRWRLDADILAGCLTPPARAVLTVQPNNPTGSALDPREIETLQTLAAARGLAIISDEVFADYPFEDGYLGLPAGGPALTFRLGGLSKAAGLPQLKLSWIAVDGPRGPVREALERLEILGDTFLSVGTPVQTGLPRLLTLGEGLREQILERVRANRQALLGLRGPSEAWETLAADGGWYAVLRLPRVLPDEEWALELLERDSVLLHPGYLFDFPDDGYLVASLLPERAVFAEGVARVRDRVAAVCD